MKTTKNLLGTLLICVILIPWYSFAEILPLEQNWQVQTSRGLNLEGNVLSTTNCVTDSWYKTKVPNTILAVLEDSNVYPNLYYGTNLKKVPGYQDDLWLIMPENSPFRDPWWYRTEFSVPAEWNGMECTLHFEGINYEAEIWLNGQKIADRSEVRGMFRRFEFSVSQNLKYGEKNALAVKIYPPGLLPYKDYDTKQIEATTGWDDHNPQPPDLNMGIWQPVYIKTQGSIALRHPYVETQLNLPSLDSADLTVSAWITNMKGQEVEVTVRGTIEDRVFEQNVKLNPGEKREIIFKPEEYPVLHVRSPRIWWPAPLGEQNLYILSMEAITQGKVSDTAQTRFGIRDIRTELNEEDWRVYYVNGEKILIRGGAWMTSDMLLRLTRTRYEALIRYAKEAGLNMLRSEGFSIRETNIFYDLCDEYGVMVTQQIFGRTILEEDLAIQCVEDMMLRIRNHPSLVHFLGHDETFPSEKLDTAYQELIARHRIHRTYQPHSGTFVTTTRRSTGGTRTGTRELWTYAGPSHYYLRTHDGAWGFAQSGGIGGIIASPTSLREMLPADQLWPALDTEAWSFHTVIQGGSYFYALREAMNSCYGSAKDFNDFSRKIEAMNFNSARGMFEAYARNKYKATGITTWKYNTAWPASITWQYVDWYLRPTSAYYGAKKACEPIHVLYAYDDECVWVVNSYRKEIANLRLSAEAFHLNGGTFWSQTKDNITVSPDGKTKICEVNIPEEQRRPMFFLRLQ
ncbi:MAG: glycosyl hydrolase 2 galactose-binding domain-containing protein, partial [Candidatus Hydrogenedens sp.]